MTAAMITKKAAPDWHQESGSQRHNVPPKCSPPGSGTAIDLQAAGRFLKLLSHAHGTEVECFQTFDDSSAKRRDLAQVMPGNLGQHAAALKRLNAAGAGVFVVVNATDGQGRRAGNVTHTRALFVDLDGAPLDPLTACDIEPHLIVESSPGKWHAYWLLRPIAAHADTFKRYQHAIAARFGGDPSVCDLPRVMRLPGFIHRKGEPFQTRIFHESGAWPYELDELVKGFDLDGLPLMPQSPPGAMVTTGRHQDLIGLTARAARVGMSESAIRAAVDAEQASGRWTREMDPGEVDRAIAGAVQKYAPEPPPEPPAPPAAFDLSGARVGDLLDTRPLPRVWVVDDVLPLGCAALLAAAGGTGKSVAVLQLAVSICTGLPGWGCRLASLVRC